MFKAIKSKAMLAVLPAAMICAIAAPASAETVPTVFTGEAGSAVNIPIVKVLQLPEGASVPTETFTFTLRAVTTDGCNGGDAWFFWQRFVGGVRKRYLPGEEVGEYWVRWRFSACGHL